MYRKILVPLDGSERAEAILPHVTEIATRFEAVVLLLQVVEPSPILANPYDPTPERNQELYEAYVHGAEKYLMDQARAFQREGIAARTLLVEGPTVPMIIETAVTENVDLIAMASHGRSGLRRMVYGSVAAGVLHQAERPLLLIRA